MGQSSKTYIHIGLPKTASTYLQTRVFPQIPDTTLISRPYTLQSRGFNKLQYADDTLFSRTELKSEIDALLATTNSQKILISDENLCGYAVYNFINRGFIADRLSQLFPEAEIIVFLRGQKDIVRSLYYQFVSLGLVTKAMDRGFISVPGQGMSWSDYRNAPSWDSQQRYINFFGYMNRDNFLYSKLIDLYCQKFDRVHVLLYEDLLNHPEQIISQLGEILGSKIPAVLGRKTNSVVNRRMSDQKLVEQLFINKLVRVSRRSESKVGRVLAYLAGLLFDKDAFIRRQESYLDTVIEPGIFAPDNRMLENKYGVGVNNYPDSYHI